MLRVRAGQPPRVGAGPVVAAGRRTAGAALLVASPAASCSLPSSLKKPINCCSCSAWPLISSAVAASSSEAEAFCWVVWLSWPIALLICPTPVACSCEAAAISCTSSEVFWIAGTISLEQLAGLLGHRHAVAGQVADLLRRHLAALGQLAHLGGHHREALAVLAGARRLDRRVQRQQVGLVGDVVDDADLLGDLLHRRDRLLHRLAAFGGLPRRLAWPCRR